MINGDASRKAPREAKQQEVAAALAKALEATAVYAEPRVSTRRERLRTRWESLAGDVAAGRVNAAASFARHSAMVKEELALVDDIMNASGLDLDADPTTHHLGTTALRSLPRLSELMGQARARGAGYLAKGNLEPVDRVVLTQLMDAVQEQAQQVVLELDRAADASPAKLLPLADKRVQATKAAEDAVNLVQTQLLQLDAPGMASAAYFSAITVHIDAQYALTAAVFDELRNTFDQDAAQARRALWLMLPIW